MKTDVLVIGSGPAGMQSAISARKEGAEVTIVERDVQLGGILNQCIHHGFGVHFFRENLTGNQFAERLKDELEGINIRLNTMVLGVEDHRVVCSSPSGTEEIECKALILAMGCREKTRDALGIPGSRPAGVFTAGQVQRFINVEGHLPGREIVILGSGDVGLIMARRLTLEGCRVRGVVEIMPHPGGLLRNVVQCLDDFDIPLLLSHTVTSVRGKDRVESVEVCEADKNLRPISGSEKSIPCDTFILSVGMIPENDLVTECVKMDPITGGADVNQYFQTSAEWIFACGNALHVNDLVDNVARESDTAGSSAAFYALGKLKIPEDEIRVRAESGLVSVIPQRLNGLSRVRFYMRVSKPMKKVNIRVRGSGVKFFKRFVRPAESVVISMAEKRLLEAGGEVIFGIEAGETDEEKVIKTYVCTLCPIGCEISLSEEGSMKGYQCKRGIDFVSQEEKEPMRILTTTVYVDGGEFTMLPVRSRDEIRKKDMREAMQLCAKFRAQAPVGNGEVLFSFKGMDFIATRSIKRV